jgi:hypothetical protein
LAQTLHDAFGFPRKERVRPHPLRRKKRWTNVPQPTPIKSAAARISPEEPGAAGINCSQWWRITAAMEMPLSISIQRKPPGVGEEIGRGA